ncbi:MAG: BamA/TamA family outer membrane protein [Terrimonas sp.]|nr:BamA/TamA family outer membrane protein [Terrimonas sp.]
MNILKGRPTIFFSTPLPFLAGLVILLASSCAVVTKNYPANKPFVYETNIKIEGNFSKEESSSLSTKLNNQLDDSLQVKTVRKFFYKGFNMPTIINAVAYDSLKAEKSIVSMENLLRTLGYYHDSIAYDTKIRVRKKDPKPDEMRTIITFHVFPGKQFKLDSVYYSLIDTAQYHPNQPDLQSLTNNSLSSQGLKKGDVFSKQNISSEIDRLVTLYRNNGYLKFSRDELIAVWDTLDPALLRPAIDPVEQLFLLEQISKKRENPTANVEFRLKDDFSNERLTRYFIGNTTIYPDYTSDTLAGTKKVVILDSNYKVISYTRLFKTKFLGQNIYFKKGELYNQQNYLKTVNRFNSLGAWRLVNIEQLTRTGSDTVDMNILLTPANKYSFTTNLEVSGNNNALIQGNLLGLGANATLLNRNFAHSSNQSNLNVRYNTELSTRGRFIATQQAGVSYSINFPRLIPNLRFLGNYAKERSKTTLSMAYSNTDTKNYFIVNSLNLSWGYDIAWKNKSLHISLPNFEYTVLQKRDSLNKLIERNPSFKNIFNQGLVFSIQGGFKISGGKGKNVNLFSSNIEESGLLTGFIRSQIFDSLYRFIKLDGEFVRSMVFGKKQLVTRVYSGIGIALKTPTRSSDIQMPYFRQFFAGGPNSMRAWNLRTLGPGSALKTKEEAPFRFGDFMFETNVELRFPLTKLAGYNVTSALFTDIGNVWFIRQNNDFPNGQLTSLNKFFKDLAVGVGTGLRFDFEFLVVRLDYSLKARNPSPYPDNAASQSKWFYHWTPGNLLKGVLQLGISYPFIRF